ncbi:AsmA family protein [Azospirillum halopraeferens]|uniref:AsmA family protein n=1 Tax=Azospirillum halopraeferens TaxID=34010 RepID=UPI0004172EE0|nr:AsmA family protein [Azospirillum halopraeferens]
MAVVKWVGLTLLGLAGLTAAGIGVAALVWDWNDARGFLAARAGEALGRPVSLDGDLHVRLGNPVRIRAEGVRIANEPWGRDPWLADIPVLEVGLRPWPLLRGDVELTDMVLTGPVVSLERSEQGEDNWDLGAEPADDGAGPDHRGEMPVVERLRVEDGRLRYRNPQSDVDLDSTISTAVGAEGDDRVHLQGEGTFAGEPFSLTLEGGSLRFLRDTSAPYPIRAEAAVGPTRGVVEGTLNDPVRFEGVDLAVDLKGDDLSAVFPIFGIPAPQTGPYDLRGTLTRDGPMWRVTGLTGRVGGTDLDGTVTIDAGGDRTRVTAELVSERLVLADLAGFVGGAPEEGDDYPVKEPGRILPDTPVNLDRLRATDLELRLRGQRVESAAAALDNFGMVLTLDNGVITVDPLSFGMGDGRILGAVRLDGRERIPAVAVDLTVRGIRLPDLFAGSGLEDRMGGVATGRIALEGRGATLADAAAVADGSIGLAVDGGTVGSLIVQGLQTDIVETLGIVLTGEEPAPFNCFVVDLAVEGGVGRTQAMVLDTPETLLVGEGTIDLGVETLDLTVRGRPKQPGVLSTEVPVHIRGRFASPDVSLDPTETAARGAAAVALGVLLTPLAGLLPLLDPGTDEQPHCGTLIRSALTPDTEAAEPDGNGAPAPR